MKVVVGVEEEKVNFTGACAKFNGSGSIRTDLEATGGNVVELAGVAELKG